MTDQVLVYNVQRGPTMTNHLGRRTMLKLTGAAAAAQVLRGQTEPNDVMISKHGAIAVGRAPAAAQAGHDILAKGGNAIDAAVAAALTACVVEPASCGIAGYGTHITIGRADGTVACIDANSMAPQAARPDMFKHDGTGQVPGKVNYYGWLAAGIPGVMGGLQAALDGHGRKKLGDVAESAIRYARDGFAINQGLAKSFQGSAGHFRRDSASKKLYFDGDEPIREGATYRNPDLARLLETFAERGTADSFYRGDIGRQIADAFQKNGGIATADDFAAYEAKLVQTNRLSWRGYSMHTAPVTAGGLSTIQALAILKALKWEEFSKHTKKSHAALEALRLVWADRFRYFGDPEFVDVPVKRLLSTDYISELADKVSAAVKAGKPIEQDFDSYEQKGTIHISASDREGNVIALTITHGGGYGARVTVPGLGLTLGHGVSRFDPRPGRANSIGPRKRPLNNMTPTVVLQDGRPVLALGARGGRRIPNAVYSVLLPFVGEDRSMTDSVNAPRMNSLGNMNLALDSQWDDDSAAFFENMGYKVSRGAVAILSAASVDPKSGKVNAAFR